jgi:hypothetical protein
MHFARSRQVHGSFAPLRITELVLSPYLPLNIECSVVNPVGIRGQRVPFLTGRGGCS